jgi:hypothetical protein
MSLVPKFTIRRATHWRDHRNQSPRTGARRQLWRLGRSFQHIRLRGQGNTEEGRSVERYHRRLLHRWLASCTRRLPVDAQRRHILCDSPSSYRGRLDWLQPYDGRQHKTRCSPAASSRPRTLSKRWRRRHGSSCMIFELPYILSLGE